eukprot:scaffold3892_cov177-Skeletonema_marinoi.AAC.1
MSFVHGHFGIFDFAFVGETSAICISALLLHSDQSSEYNTKTDLTPSAMIAIRTAKTCFVYGTLMSEEVLHCLLGRIPRMQPKVILQNHSRHPVRQHVYPGVIPSTSTSASVEGALLFDLSSLDLKLLDYFEEEGVDYKRTDVQVQIPDVSSLDEDIQTLVTNNSNKDDNCLSSRILKTQAYIWLKDTA